MESVDREIPENGNKGDTRNVDIDKVITDVFDMIASAAGKMSASKSPEMPDLSWVDVDRMLPDEETTSRERFFAGTDTVPEIEFRRVKRYPMVDVWDGTYPSAISTDFPENNTVHVRHFRLQPARRNRPVILVINGLHVDAAFDFYFEWWCLRFAAWGFDSAMVTIPFSQDRAPKDSYSGQLLITSETKWTLFTLRQTFMDIQLYVNRLKADDAGPVGLFGVSYGGLVSGIYVCNAGNADFSIMCMPPVDIVDVFSKWDFADALRERETHGETTLLTDPRMPNLMSLRCMRPKVPLNRVFLASGKFDHLVPSETVDKMVRDWGGMPWFRMYPTGHINTFALNFRMIHDLNRFLKKEIL
jgi:hypothetical protein